MFPLFYYLFITSPLCPRFRLLLPLFVKSHDYLFKVSIVLVSVYTSLLCSRLQLSRLLFLTSPCSLLKVSIDSLSVCYVTAVFEATTVSSSVGYVIMLSHHGFHCFIICLLRHYSVQSFDCLFLCLLCHYFIQAISVVQSQLLLRGAPDSVPIRRSLTPKRHRQLRVKDLPKVPSWQLKRD